MQRGRWAAGDCSDDDYGDDDHDDGVGGAEKIGESGLGFSEEDEREENRNRLRRENYCGGGRRR